MPSGGWSNKWMKRASTIRVLLLLLSATVVAAPTCAGQDGPTSEDRLVAALQEVPDDVTTRFILTIDARPDGTPDHEGVKRVVAALSEAGAEQVDALAGTSIVFTSCRKSAVLAAIDTGLVESVQIDRLSKPLKPKH